MRRNATGYEFEAPTRFDKLFSGVAFKRPVSLPYTTDVCEGIGPDDTFDADYGVLLERAYGKVATSPTGVVQEWTRKVPGEVKAA